MTLFVAHNFQLQKIIVIKIIQKSKIGKIQMTRNAVICNSDS